MTKTAVNDILFKPIGIIHTPFKEPEGTPINPSDSDGACGSLEIFPEYAEGLKDIDGFSHIIVLFLLHMSGPASMIVTPFLDTAEHGVFATRAPSRPNPIGFSVVELLSVKGNILNIRNIDIVDGAPVLDIKPYIEKFDSVHTYKGGWIKGKLHESHKIKDDGRFIK